MDGVLNVCKPLGPTSHDVVNQVRRIFGQKRVGHAGTLDPMAEGVLVVCLGRATRIVQYLVGARKEYRASMTLGRSTDTQDSTGKVTAEADASGVTQEALYGATRSFVGDIEQIPPMVSAVKYQGRRLYELARRGEQVERQPRQVTIHELELLSFAPGGNAEARISVICSSGTYIRTLCADIGAKLGCGAHMSSLVRTRVGRFDIETSVSLDALAGASTDTLAGYLVDMKDALGDMPSITLDRDEANSAVHGMPVASRTCSKGEFIRLLGPDSALLAVGAVSELDDGLVVRPKTVLADPGS